MAEVGAIAKGRKNQQQGYQFRGIDDAYQAFQPVFSKLGVFVVPTVLKVTREERQTKSGSALIYTTMEVKHTFFCAEDGSSFDAVTIGEAMDSGDKSSNKAMSAAMKYALLEVFCVPTEGDNDTENHSPAPLPKNAPEAKSSAPQTAPKPAPKPAAPATPSKSHAERLNGMMSKILELGVLPKEINAFAFAQGYIKADGNAETDWPESAMPKSKAEFDKLCQRIVDFAQGDITP
jgi:hypothetical protein